MELDNIGMDITESNDDAVYENLKIATIQSCRGSDSKKIVGEENYETLSFSGCNKGEVENGNEDTLKRLKRIIYVMTVLMIILYITLISMLIVMFVPKDSVDGQWAEWLSWTSCDVTCGKGTRQRTRICHSPFPTKHEISCTGENLQMDDCYKDICPVDGQWAHWSSWTTCDVTCGIGTHLRLRTCTNPVPLKRGSECIGESLQSSKCTKDKCPVDGQWAHWSSWTSCNVTCGKETQQRTRTCSNPSPVNGGIDCTGENLQTAECTKDSCSVNGQWSHWSNWTSCDVSCGNGTHLRLRTCTNPIPMNGGNECIGDNFQSSKCTKDNCPVDGQWTNWSSWTSCDVTCGMGRQLRTRRCTHPMPQNQGKDCIGENLQISQCSRENCSVI